MTHHALDPQPTSARALLREAFGVATAPKKAGPGRHRDSGHSLGQAHARAILGRAGGVAAALALTVSGGAYAATNIGGANDSPVERRLESGSGSTQATQAALGGTIVAGSAPVITTVSEDASEQYGTVEEQSASLPEGTRQVKTAGVNGVTRTTYQVTTVDGQETSREVLSSVVVTPKVDEVVLVGTAKQATAAAASSGGATTTAVSGDVWAALAQCESGGNPATNTGNGFYGMYQFTLSTWRALGGTGLPSEASAAEQTAMAQKLQARAGWGQWPACTRKLGLR